MLYKLSHLNDFRKIVLERELHSQILILESILVIPLQPYIFDYC